MFETIFQGSAAVLSCCLSHGVSFAVPGVAVFGMVGVGQKVAYCAEQFVGLGWTLGCFEGCVACEH